MKYAGIDWTYNQYDLLVIDEAGHSLEHFQIKHSEHALQELATFLRTVPSSGTEDSLACVIPSSNGVLEAFLATQGFAVSIVKPVSTLLIRADWNMSIERTGAEVLAELGRRKLPHLARLNQNSELIDATDEIFQLLNTRASFPRLTAYGQDLEHGPLCFQRGPQEHARVALTFDDGPHPVYTPQILAVLRRYGIQATFFCIGLHLDSYTDIARQAQAEGHLLANHTWSHPYLCSLLDEEVTRQIATANTFLRERLGAQPRFFRPPYAALNVRTVELAALCGVQTVLWSVDPNDWAMPGTARIVDNTLHTVTNGSIILLHDGGGDRHQTVEALPVLIERLFQAGYTFVTLDQLS